MKEIKLGSYVKIIKRPSGCFSQNCDFCSSDVGLWIKGYWGEGESFVPLKKPVFAFLKNFVNKGGRASYYSTLKPKHLKVLSRKKLIAELL